MSRSMYDIMLHPTRMRIVQLLSSRESMTTSEICKIIIDVPQTTVYRHIGILLDANVLSIIKETKIRGSMERTLSLNIEKLDTNNYADNIPQQAFAFLMNIYAKFDKYFNQENFKPGNNKIFFNHTVMMMSDQEFDLFLSELQMLFVKYHFEAGGERKPREISIISAPPTESEE